MVCQIVLRHPLTGGGRMSVEYANHLSVLRNDDEMGRQCAANSINGYATIQGYKAPTLLNGDFLLLILGSSQSQFHCWLPT